LIQRAAAAAAGHDGLQEVARRVVHLEEADGHDAAGGRATRIGQRDPHDLDLKAISMREGGREAA